MLLVTNVLVIIQLTYNKHAFPHKYHKLLTMFVSQVETHLKTQNLTHQVS